MLYNEIYEVGQHVALFESIIKNAGFKRLILLTKPMGSPFIHRETTIDSYSIQEWKFMNPDSTTDRVCLSLGKVNPPRVEPSHPSTSYNMTSTDGFTYILSPS